MGGLVGAMLAKSKPGAFDRLVLVDAAGFSTAYGWLRHLVPFAPLIHPFMKLAFRSRGILNRSRFVVGALISWAVASPFKIGAELSLMLMSGAGRPAFVPSARSIMATKIDRVTGAIACPTLIVWGRKDVLIPKRDAFRYMRICEDSDVKIVAGAGHLPMLEKPEVFNALIEEFAAAAETAETPVAA
jgi:pimeloyl-ACP methyl ester carboxylesterase